LLLAALSMSAVLADPLHAWVDGDDPAKLEQWVAERLGAEQASLSKLLAVKGKRTVANTLEPYDEAQNQLALAGNQAYLAFAVGKTAELRSKGQMLNEKVASAVTDLNLNQKVYEALAAVPLPDRDPATRQYVKHTLLEYKLAGVSKDEATRNQIHALQDKITSLSLTFNRNVQDGMLSITATKAELDGLPADLVARLKANADGTFTLTTDEPDRAPVMTFASDAGLRRRMYLAYNTRAYPANKQVLLDLLAARQQLAAILGFPTYADLATADQMTGNAANVHKLLDEIDAASRDITKQEYAQLLAMVQKRQPGTTAIPGSDSAYWAEQYRRERYAFDAQSVRPYFPYDKVETGILDTAAKIFHVRFAPVKDAALWHPSVTVFDVIDGGKKVGRIYLDMHPREGKDKWFSSAPVVPGIRGRQLPEGMLVCNFPGGVEGDPGLMEYQDVVIFFHEFGHLMHHILGSQNRWSQQGGFNVEGDFVEAPSQMLEEFFHNYGVLAGFARHYQTGEAIPADLVKRMNAADAFGRGRMMQAQMFYSAMSLNLHDRPLAQVDLDAQLRQLSERFLPFTFVEGNRMYASFTHLTGYASNYYTYALDKVIALDFYARFNRDHPLDGKSTADYRRLVINPGATKPAAELVKDFLGRPQNMAAMKTWMAEEFSN
jgi:thimet oligopeptidase